MLERNLLAGLFAGLMCAAGAEAQAQTELLARARVFPEVGAGIRALKHRPARRTEEGPAGRYYVLTAPGPGVLIYDASGQRVGQIPAAAPSASRDGRLIYGDDLDVDAVGRVYVADRGANAVKVFNPDGTLALSVPIAAPTSVAALAEGEFAVASMKSVRLVTVFSSPGKAPEGDAAATRAPGKVAAAGRVVREFGEPAEIAERGDLNRFLNIGTLATDRAGHVYYAFSYVPEPTVRKYDRHGYAALEIELTGLDFQPAAQAARREIQRQQRGGAPNLKPTITALGVDPATQQLWVALGNLLLHFDPDGNRRGAYRTFTPEGARLEARVILVEPERLLLAADPLGIYEFPRPDKARP